MSWLGYYWKQSKGYRLCPWRSPYIRWRAETYWGGDMHDLSARRFFRLIWRDRAALRRFLAWADEREREQRHNRGAEAARLSQADAGYTTPGAPSTARSEMNAK